MSAALERGLLLVLGFMLVGGLAAAQSTDPGASSSQDTLTVGALGAIQGLTEFLPVSSSGHLALARAAFGFETVAGPLLVVALHVGTLLAVLAVYGRDLWGVLTEALDGRARPALLLLVGTLPAGLVGVLFKGFLEGLFEQPDVAAACLIVTAVLLLLGDRARRVGKAAPRVGLPGVDPSGIAGMRYTQALLVGVTQAVAILPGISRSGSTISAGLLCGLDAAQAARFSFLLSVPAIGGAALLELKDASEQPQGGLWLLLFGLLVSAVIGLLSLKLLLIALRGGAFRWFALYCAVVGATWLLFHPFGGA